MIFRLGDTDMHCMVMEGHKGGQICHTALANFESLFVCLKVLEIANKWKTNLPQTILRYTIWEGNDLHEKSVLWLAFTCPIYSWPHSFSCAARCGKRQISCHNKRYIQSRPRTGEVQTRHEYWHLSVTMPWL